MDYTQNKHYDELRKSFMNNRVFVHMHPYELYRNWLEAVWLFCDAANDREAFRTGLDRYTRAQGEELGRLFSVYVAAVEVLPFQDILGQLFMELDVKSVHAGQFFTPGHVAEMMARMQFNKEEFLSLVKEKGEVSVCDPAVGSGVMLLAYAKVVHAELGQWGLGKLRLYGMDIDQRCVHMCRIQLRMNGLDYFGRMAAILTGAVPARAIETDNKESIPALPEHVESESPESVGPICPGKTATVEQLVLFQNQTTEGGVEPETDGNRS